MKTFGGFRGKAFTLMCVVLLLAIVMPAVSAFAAKEMTIDDEEYNLYVDEYPDGISEGIYAKMKSSKSNIDDYYLNFSSEDSEDVFSKAVKNSGISTKDKLQASMTAALYKITDDDDKKITDTTIVLLPVPDDCQERPEEATLYMVSGGKVKPVSTTLYNCDDVYYNQFTLSSYTTYGYLFTDPEVFEEDEDEDEDEPTKKPKDNKATPTPTKKPKDKKATPTPTKKPSSGKNTPTPTPKSSGSSAGKNSGSKKDNVPKTGDDFSYGRYIAIGVLAAGALVFAVNKLKK